MLVQIPWRTLGQSSVVVEIDSVFLLACPTTEVDVIVNTSHQVNRMLCKCSCVVFRYTPVGALAPIHIDS